MFVLMQKYYVLRVESTNETWGQFCPLLVSVYVVMCVPFGRPSSRWQRPGRDNWAVMVELTFLYI